MNEAKSNTLLNAYLREKRLFCYYELKVARGLYFTFSKIEEHQDKGLPALAKEGLVWKLSDEDSRQKPCDGFCAPPLPAYLVIRFKTRYYFIPYEHILDMKANGQKSISEDEASALSVQILKI
jgi:hypothetical protein